MPVAASLSSGVPELRPLIWFVYLRRGEIDALSRPRQAVASPTVVIGALLLMNRDRFASTEHVESAPEARRRFDEAIAVRHLSAAGCLCGCRNRFGRRRA